MKTDITDTNNSEETVHRFEPMIRVLNNFVFEVDEILVSSLVSAEDIDITSSAPVSETNSKFLDTESIVQAPSVSKETSSSSGELEKSTAPAQKHHILSILVAPVVNLRPIDSPHSPKFDPIDFHYHLPLQLKLYLGNWKPLNIGNHLTLHSHLVTKLSLLLCKIKLINRLLLLIHHINVRITKSPLISALKRFQC